MMQDEKAGETRDLGNAHAQEAVARYRERFKQFGVDHRSLGWRPQTSAIRFDAVWRDLQRLGMDFSLLDVGCGFGELLPFLREQGWRGDYTGIDVVPEFIETAKGSHQDAAATWICGDLLALRNLEQGEAAFASGVLNHRHATDHETYQLSFMDRMAAIATRFIAVDFLSAAADRRRDDLSFQDPAALANLARRYSKRFIVDHSYMPYEVMLKIWLDDRHPEGVPLFEGR